MESRYLRIAYAIQYVVTFLSTFEIWSQVGGQAHLDLMPWYWKLLLGAVLSLAVVKATSSAVRRDRFRNPGTTAWLSAAAVVMVAMGLLTYYEHLHEPTDEEEEAPARVDLTLLHGR